MLDSLPEKLVDVISIENLIINGNNFKEVPRQAYYLVQFQNLQEVLEV